MSVFLKFHSVTNTPWIHSVVQGASIWIGGVSAGWFGDFGLVVLHLFLLSERVGGVCNCIHMYNSPDFHLLKWCLTYIFQCVDMGEVPVWCRLMRFPSKLDVFCRATRRSCVWEVYWKTEWDGFALVAMSVKPRIKYQRFTSSGKVSEVWYKSKSTYVFKISYFFAARALAFDFLRMNHLHQFSNWWGMNPLNSVQMWFILIVTLGCAVAPLQDGSVHKKIKAEAFIWNLFVNSGLWDQDMLSACECRPAEAWTSPKPTNSHLGMPSPTRTPSATVLTLWELELSCSRMHVLHDWAYFCGSWCQLWG